MFEICLLCIDKKKTDRTLRYTRSTDYAQYSDRALIEGCLETDRQTEREKEREREREEKEKFTFEETKGVLVIHGGAKNDRGSLRQRKNEKKRKERIR